MPYTCKSCGRYQLGASADGICPASECQPARQAAAMVKGSLPRVADVERAIAARYAERAAIVKWLRSEDMPGGDPHVACELADRIEAGEHLGGQ